MMDRLSIETIKREDFAKNKRPLHMTESSKKLSNRVEKYLVQKLEEIDRKGFYECVHEQRTYDLEGIVKEPIL
jgi:ribosomal protein S17E